MKQSQETCQFFNNPFMTCDVRVGIHESQCRYYQFGVVSRMIFATLCFSSCIRKSSWSTGEMGADYMLSNMVCVLCCPDILHRAGKEWSK